MAFYEVFCVLKTGKNEQKRVLIQKHRHKYIDPHKEMLKKRHSYAGGSSSVPPPPPLMWMRQFRNEGRIYTAFILKTAQKTHYGHDTESLWLHESNS